MAKKYLLFEFDCGMGEEAEKKVEGFIKRIEGVVENFVINQNDMQIFDEGDMDFTTLGDRELSQMEEEDHLQIVNPNEFVVRLIAHIP